jgi:hypothetical protein
MVEAVSVARGKHPGRVEGGRLGARRRWGPPRVARLDELEPPVRAAVVALLEADRAAKARAAAQDAA